MKIINKYINREYTVLEKYEAGIVLTGAEVKSVRKGNIQFKDAFVKIMEDGAVLINCEIPIYKFARPETYFIRRTRKLLLHKSELIRLKTKLSSSANLTIIPLSCYTKRALIKIEIALCKGKKTWEKKKVEKERDVERQTEKEIKEYIKT